MTCWKRVSGFALVLFLAACAQQPATESAETATPDPETVRAVVAQFVSSWNAADFATMRAMVAEDAVLMQPDGPALEGREAILATISGNYDPALFQQTATVDEIAFVGELAYARGTWKTEPIAGAGPDTGSANGKWSVLYRPTPDGGWQAWRWMWNQPSGQAGNGAAPE
ncbi:MAG: nuclear transport factor 2 family protein [Gemmatimonadota bacterium]|jgi:uncharacterized protein (TIGR02246 family)